MKNLFVYFAFCLLAFSSCKKNVATPNQSQNVNIYVAGYEFVGDQRIAKYWKNGVVETLPNDLDGGAFAVNAIASAIVASGNDVYIAGIVSYGGYGGSIYGRCWKNKTTVDLTGGSTSAIPSGITISGNDIYVCGSEGDNPIYYKNGIPHILGKSDTASYSYATSIAVSGSDVYVAGYENLGGHVIAKYWKNGTSVIVNDSLQSGFTTSITIAGNDVYMAGEGFANGINGSSYAKYWKNGAPVNLGDTTIIGAASSIFVSGSDVYVAGYQTGATKYWKNGIPVVLTEASTANCIFVSGNDVYVAGSTFSGNAVYWKNGQLTTLDAGTEASSIFITNL